MTDCDCDDCECLCVGVCVCSVCVCSSHWCECVCVSTCECVCMYNFALFLPSQVKRIHWKEIKEGREGGGVGGREGGTYPALCQRLLPSGYGFVLHLQL